MVRRWVILILVAALWSTGETIWAQEAPDFVALIEVDDVMQHIETLAVQIGVRRMGSPEEALAAGYIADQFEQWGYEVEIQEFETTAYSEDDEPEDEVTSWNVIATRIGAADDAGMIVIGAHMDSVTLGGTGASDNASGVAVVLAAAEVLAEYDTEPTLVFITFGSEESGYPSGADVFIESLGDSIEDVIAMINIDTVGIGTDLNVYAGAVIDEDSNEDEGFQFEGGPVWVRDLALELAAEMGLPFKTSPLESWDGYTGAWSDHYAFVLQDVPVAYFEAWLWTGVNNPWFGQETPEGDYLHTDGDVIENVVPEKVEMVAEVVTATVYAVMTGYAP